MRRTTLTAVMTTGLVLGVGAWLIGAGAVPASEGAAAPSKALSTSTGAEASSSALAPVGVKVVTAGEWTSMGTSGVSMRLTDGSMCVAPGESADKDLIQDMPNSCVDVSDPNLSLSQRGHVSMRAAWGNVQVFYGISTVGAASVQVTDEHGRTTAGEVLELSGGSFRAFYVVTPWNPYTISADAPMPPAYDLQISDAYGRSPANNLA